jgi:hypothetical protein
MTNIGNCHKEIIDRAQKSIEKGGGRPGGLAPRKIDSYSFYKMKCIYFTNGP